MQQAEGLNGGSGTYDADAGLTTPHGRPELPIIQLDQPCDDGMVQTYIRSGWPPSMQAHITGVGNIYSPQGPVHILREGRNLLAGVSTVWGRTQEYVSILAALEKAHVDNDFPMP
jgi:hypothetical protein